MIITDERKAALVDIQKFFGTGEYACRFCGSVNPWEKVSIRSVLFKSNKKQNYTPVCPDCQLKGNWLLQSKVEKIFWKGSMSEVDSFDTGLLTWMLQKNYFGIKKPLIRKAVERVLEGRLFKVEAVKDIPMDMTKMKALTRIHEVEVEIEEHERISNNLKQKLIDDSDILDYFDVKKYSNQIKTRQRRIKTGRRILAELLTIENENDERRK